MNCGSWLASGNMPAASLFNNYIALPSSVTTNVICETMSTSFDRSVKALLPVYLLCLSFSTINFCVAVDTITNTESIRDPETVVSAGGQFKLGFFSPGNSTHRYVGISYNDISVQRIVWVANRENPLTDSSGVFTIADDGNLVVLNGQKRVLWSTNVSNFANNSVAQLLDSGNLVLSARNSDDSNDNGRTLWESFQHPSDTFLPRMQLGANLKKNEKTELTSWKSDSNPSLGSFTLGIVPLNIPQVFIWNGSVPRWRSGPWNGRIFIGVPRMYSVYLNGFNLVKDNLDQSAYLTFSFANVNDSFLLSFVLSSEGNFVQMQRDDGNTELIAIDSIPKIECDIYGKCGPFGSCNALESPICSCLRGFEPNSIEEWSKGNWSSGCVRRAPLQCEGNISSGGKGKADGFLKLERMKVPDFADWLDAEDVKECEELCLRTCSCVAYAYDTGIGCMSWSGGLIDIQKFFTVAGVDLYIRLAYSELDKGRDLKVIIIVTVLVTVIITIVIFIYFYMRWKARQRGGNKKLMEMPLFDLGEGSIELSDANMLGDNMKQGNSPELLFFNFENLATATNNFHLSNKLGEGGFGAVYKGKLLSGKQIAVKRLSKSSGQGIEEFKNEVIVISKLQHRNLVRLLGACIEGEEKMLIYEYLANKSLDAFVFDPTKRALLDWKIWFHIIEGIGRGLLYLHRDSRLRIIHRDLKASNILLDEELNPKISDFGMARIFGGTQDEAKTRRVVGTYGYMSPEYAMEGRFSGKSDVFSFGVLLLEIISGKKNTSFCHHPEFLTLLGYAWCLWNEGKTLELIEPTLCDPCFQEEVLRCIHVGLLCVQEFAKDRPTIAIVVSMLCSEITRLPTPKKPPFTEMQISSNNDSSQGNNKICSINNVTVTLYGGR